MTKFTLTKKAVNSKLLCDDIIKIVEEGLNSHGIMWSSEVHRTSFAETLEEILSQIADETGKITQWKVLCDRRNNTTSNMNKGLYKLEIQYKQRNCLNMTRLIYKIIDKPNQTAEDDGVVDWI